MSNWKARLLAYIVDTFIITMLLTLISGIIPERSNYEKLLLNKKEILKLRDKVQIEGYTLIPVGSNVREVMVSIITNCGFNRYYISECMNGPVFLSPL